MLVVARRPGEGILLQTQDGTIQVQVLSRKHYQNSRTTRLGIVAPQSVRITRLDSGSLEVGGEVHDNPEQFARLDKKLPQSLRELATHLLQDAVACGLVEARSDLAAADAELLVLTLRDFLEKVWYV